MAGTVRIEKCPTDGAAATRAAALAALEYVVTRCQGSVELVIAAYDQNGKALPTPTRDTIAAPFIVIGCRDS